MRIELKDIGKKYHRSFLFKGLNLTFQQGNSYAILGPNGSGKSTLLKVISGFVSPTKGSIHWSKQDQEIELNKFHRYFSFTSPYLELFEELTLTEHLKMHFELKTMKEGMSLDSLIEKSLFEGDKNKQLKHFSSGMMQRLKLAMALFDQSPILLLDEPCTNMDEKGIAWYRSVINEIRHDKLLIVASNQKHEYDFCENLVDLGQL